MTDGEALDLVKAALIEVQPDRRNDFENVTLETPVQDLALDSLKMMEMIACLEDTLVRTFEEQRLRYVVTLGDIVTLVRDDRKASIHT
jgi:acyl carrier protein